MITISMSRAGEPATSHRFEGDRIRIGRSPGCDVMLELSDRPVDTADEDVLLKHSLLRVHVPARSHEANAAGRDPAADATDPALVPECCACRGARHCCFCGRPAHDRPPDFHAESR